MADLGKNDVATDDSYTRHINIHTTQYIATSAYACRAMEVQIDSNKLDTVLSAAGEPNVPLFPASDPLVLGNTTLETTTERKSILIRSGMRGKTVQLLLCPNSLYVRHDILRCTAPLGPVQGNSTLYLLLERLLSSRDSVEVKISGTIFPAAGHALRRPGRV